MGIGWDKKKASEWSCLDVYNWASSVDRIQAAAFILRECNTDGKKLEVMTEVSLTQSPFNFTPELSKAILDEYKGAKNIFNVMSFDLDDVLGDLTDFVTANDTSSTSTTTTATTSAAAAAKPLGTSARSRAKSPNFFYLQPNAGGKHITYLSTLSSVQHASLTCGTGSSIYKKTTPTGHSQRYSTPPATAAATAHATQTPTATATAKTTVSEPKATPITTTNVATTTNTAIDTNTTVVKLTPTPVATAAATTATATTTITAEPVPTPAVATVTATATATATPVVLPTVQTVSTQPVDNAATATVVSVELKSAAQVTPPTQVQATPVTPALTDLSTAMATAAAEAAPQLITTETAETAPQESAAATTAITATDLKPEATPVVLPAADSPVIAVELTPATPVVVTADAQLQFVSSNAELTPITSSEPVPVTPTTTSTSSTTIPEAAVDVTANMPSIMPEVATVATPEPISITTTTTSSSLSSLSLSTPAIATTPATTVTAEQVPTSTTTATVVTVEPTAVISAAATTATTTTTMMPTCPEAERPPVVVTHSQNHETSSPAMSSQPVTPQPIILTTTTEHNKASSSSNNGSPSPTDKEKDKEKEKEREKRGKSKFFFGSSSLLDKGSSSNTDSPESKKRHLITRILRPRSSSPGEISSDSSSSSNSSSSSSNSNSGPSNPGQPRPPENAELRGDPEALKAAICEMDRRSNSGTEFKDYWSSRPLPWDAWAPAATPSEAASSTSLIALDCTRAKYVVELCGAAGVQRAVPDIGLSIVAGEEEADFYGTFIAPHPHETYVFPSIPAVVSLLAPGKQVGPWCKAIVRTPEADKRVMVLFEKKTIRAVMPDMWQRGTLEKSALLENGLARYEAVHKPSPHFKFGVIYVKADQTDENAMFGNKHTEASEDYKDFLRFLGQEITLRGWSKYCGGLDASADATGTVSVYTEFKGHEIMFHVGTLLPDQEHDPQKVEKKRHIGNDVVVIIFKEQSSPEDRFDPRILTSHFNHCFFVFSVAKRDDKGAATHYRMTVGFKPGVPPTQPYLPESNVYEKNSTSRELFLTKSKYIKKKDKYNNFTLWLLLFFFHFGLCVYSA